MCLKVNIAELLFSTVNMCIGAHLITANPLFHTTFTNVVHVVHFMYKYTLAVKKKDILVYKYMYMYFI